MFNGKLNEFCKIQNENVRAKGFWDSMDKATVLAQFSGEDAGQNTKDILGAFISQKIALIMSECGESLEAMRKNNYGLEQKDTFEDELADVFIRLCDLCGELDIDIEKQIEWKTNHNKARPNKHGKSF